MDGLSDNDTLSWISCFPFRSVKGVHLNMFPVRTTASMAKLFIGSFVPSLVMSPSDAEKIYPYMENLKNKILKEMGYYLLQSTKPDTVGKFKYITVNSLKFRSP